MIIKACPGHPLLLGRLGENLAREIVFVDEVAAWLSEYPNAAIGLLNQRPGDTQGYPVARAVVSGGALHWTVTNTDLSAEGSGRCELVATDNGVVVKSAIYDTIILTALDGSGETPEPWEDWREYFIALKDEAEGSAEAAAGSATAAGQSAEDAATSAAAAQESAEAIQDMGVESETLPPGSPLSVEKTIDPETGAVTLTFYLAPGQGGVSPTIAVTEITGGHRVTITDAEGTRSFDVMDGTNGDDGRGIASAVMNADYTLTLTYTDGTSYTTPSLRGAPGADGYSPVASVSKSGKVATISITDRQGTTTATVNDGEDGTPGVSPAITVTDIAGGHRVTITDATGPHSFDVMDGTGSVQDVQVAGTSVVQDGVANVPLASPTTPGVITSGTITVTGTTPSITALPGIRYVCGEVATLDITLPASGIVDVVFESGATPTVLTITPPTGVTVKWANGFDPTALDAGTTYEINIADGLGVAVGWT